jgi:hypothetical protein
MPLEQLSPEQKLIEQKSIQQKVEKIVKCFFEENAFGRNGIRI